MPKYKLILTVQDSYGMTKEIEAGTVDADNYELTETELQKITSVMDKTFATETEVDEVVDAAKTEIFEELPEIIDKDENIHSAIEQNVDTIRYSGFTD